MTPLELRSSVSLASLFALRMLGLFLILPVFAVHARGLPGGDDATLIGLALGIYGLTQGALQIPFGMASDRFGRKPVIVFGLLVFAAGSFVAAATDDLVVTIAGRAIQGAGAISAAVTAMIADSTRDSQRTKAMAMVGGSIGLTFALSLVGAPLLYEFVGMGGIFAVTGLLALAAIAVIVLVTPAVPPAAAPAAPTPFARIALDTDLLRLNFGIFTLHAAQMAMFVVLPTWLADRGGIALGDHWKLYLPVVLLSFALMVPPLFWSERAGRLRGLFLAAVALLLVVQVLLSLQPGGLVPLALLLLAFFVGFNILEASLPSLVSQLAPPAAKGTALGVYNTTQSLGLFVGGLLGGWVQQEWGKPAVFDVCAVLMAVWWLVAAGQRRWPASARGRAAA
ncbi:MAG: MFS transporter [Burkholderiaceae bacterium]|nr:MFS transporter [Burkholderiaceae bacterium]MEB2350261.1 MFS transporter [Burkholderiaceae bacterium]